MGLQPLWEAGCRLAAARVLGAAVQLPQGPSFNSHSPGFTSYPPYATHPTPSPICRLRCWFLEPSNGSFNTSHVYMGQTDQGRFEYFSRVRSDVFFNISTVGQLAAEVQGPPDRPALVPCPALRCSPPPCSHCAVLPSGPVRLSQCALEFLMRTQRQPDILHCHDWSSADVAKYYWTEYHSYGLWKPKVVSHHSSPAVPYSCRCEWH